MPEISVTFFPSAATFARWLRKHHTTTSELWVGYYKKGTGIPSITWPESVDEALCVGWIDGLRKSIDEVSYKIRFGPRKPVSIWSPVNIKRAQALIEEGRMQPAGLRAYENRKEYGTGIYSYEQRSVDLIEPYCLLLNRNEAARKFFEAQPPSYRRMMNWWIISARKEETRLRRLARLIEYSAQGQRLPEAQSRKPK